MAGVASTARLSACIASKYAPQIVARRGFHISKRNPAAQNYAMPALSPTMTEGNISKWNLKEGDSFTAGDVILEIETDKATMDVEAQDDGILWKITKPEGSKGVKVGQRIAVTADAGDDLHSLDVSVDDDSPLQERRGREEKPTVKQESKPAPAAPKQEPGKAIEQTRQEGKNLGASTSRKYPLYPSVETILHQNGLSAQDAEKMIATGPQGRLLKGDVLAYLGKIKKEYPAESSERLAKLSHLDLSNIQLAKEKLKPEVKAAEKPIVPELPEETEIAIPISLSEVIATKKRIQETLGIHLPLSTFISRASELANEDLPLNKKRKPTAEELFNSILGLSQVATSSKGRFFPHITGLSRPSLVATRPAKKPDLIDLLAPKQTKQSVRKGAVPAGISPSDNIFSVNAKAGDEKRATEYLERMKVVLEKEAGRLVL